MIPYEALSVAKYDFEGITIAHYVVLFLINNILNVIPLPVDDYMTQDCFNTIPT